MTSLGTFPALDLYPGPFTFPGRPAMVNVGGYVQPIQVMLSSLPLTATDDVDVDWVASTMDGWFGSPASTLQLTAKARAAGSWAGPRNLSSRIISLSGTVSASSLAALYDAADRLNAAASLDSTLLTVQIGDQVRSCIVYRQDAVQFTPVNDREALWTLQLATSDPRKFGASVTSSTGLPAVTGGLTFPITFPITFASNVVSGRVELVNPGNASAPVIVQINGPIVGPTVSHVGSGQTVAFRSSLSLASGEFVLVDMEGQTVLAQGDPNATRAAWVQRALPDFGWLTGDPGANTYAFNAVSGSGSVQIWQVPAWL